MSKIGMTSLAPSPTPAPNPLHGRGRKRKTLAITNTENSTEPKETPRARPYSKKPKPNLIPTPIPISIPTPTPTLTTTPTPTPTRPLWHPILPKPTSLSPSPQPHPEASSLQPPPTHSPAYSRGTTPSTGLPQLLPQESTSLASSPALRQEISSATPPQTSPALPPVGLILGRCKCPSEACHRQYGHASSYNEYVQRNKRSLHGNTGQIKILACESCSAKRQKCSLTRPCARCAKLQIPCRERISPQKRTKLDKVIGGKFCPVHGCDISQVYPSETTVSTPGGPSSPASEPIPRGRVGISIIQGNAASYTVPASPTSISMDSSSFAPSPVSVLGPSTHSNCASPPIVASPSQVIGNIDNLFAELDTQEINEQINFLSEKAETEMRMLFTELSGTASTEIRTVDITEFSKAPIYGLHGSKEAKAELQALLKEDCGVLDVMKLGEENTEQHPDKPSTEDLELEELLRDVMGQEYFASANRRVEGPSDITDNDEALQMETLSRGSNINTDPDDHLIIDNSGLSLDQMDLDVSADYSWLEIMSRDLDMDLDLLQAGLAPDATYKIPASPSIGNVGITNSALSYEGLEPQQ